MAHEKVAEELEIDLVRVHLKRKSSKEWVAKGHRAASVERSVFRHFQAEGWNGYWGEGALITNLINAMALRLPRPAPLYGAETSWSPFLDRFYDSRIKLTDILENVRTVTRNQVEQNADYMLNKLGLAGFHRGLSSSMFLGLYDAMGKGVLGSIADIFADEPQLCRAGWPDLTIWRGDEFLFLEVKAPGDTLQMTQRHVISRIIAPLSIPFALVDVQPLESGSQQVQHHEHVRKRQPQSKQDDDRDSQPAGGPTNYSFADNCYWRNLPEAELNRQLDPMAYTSLDEFKAVRDKPLQRLNLALSPQNVAYHFRDAMVATRALIRQRRKEKHGFEEELRLLYLLAALPTVPNLNDVVNLHRRPLTSFAADNRGVNLRNDLEKMQVTYDSVGDEYLFGLNITDIRWFREAWGTPSRHSNPKPIVSDSNARPKRSEVIRPSTIFGPVRSTSATNQEMDAAEFESQFRNSKLTAFWIFVLIAAAFCWVAMSLAGTL